MLKTAAKWSTGTVAYRTKTTAQQESLKQSNSNRSKVQIGHFLKTHK